MPLFVHEMSCEVVVQASWSPAPLWGPGDSGAQLSQAALAGRFVGRVGPPLSRPLACLPAGS